MKFMSSRTKSWNVDQTYENSIERGKDYDDNDGISTISGGSKAPSYSKDPTALFETPQEKKMRKRSHMVAYATMFVMTVGFSVVLSGVWPYLQSMEPDRNKQSLGWVVAANPFGQMIASPVVGAIGNRLGSIRLVCYCTMTLFILGNVMYAFLPLMAGWWTNSSYHLMIISRFIVGLSSSNVTLCRSYLAGSTTVKERTTGIAIISAAQSLGFVVGPAIQTIFSLVISDESMKYRAPGWFAALLGVINFFLLTPWVFQEFYIAEMERKNLGSNLSGTVNTKPDGYSIVGLLSSYFFSMMLFIFMETLSVPLLTDQYGLKNDTAVIIVGVLTIFSGLLAIAMIILLKKFLYRFDERKVLLFLGLIPITIGTFCYMPLYTNIAIPIANCTTVIQNATNTNYMFKSNFPVLQKVYQQSNFYYLNSDSNSDTFNESIETCTPGCPESQTWCESVSQIPYSQFLIANALVLIGFPIASALTIGLYSKTIGSRPQGLWMALLAVVLSVARVIGPIGASYVYTKLGTIVSFGTLTVGMILGIISYSLILNRLPYTKETN